MLQTISLYFWPSPTKNAKELWRILKVGGSLVIGFRSKAYMKNKTITKFGFKTYTIETLESMLYSADFRQIQSTKIKESPITDEEGKKIEKVGCFTIGYRKNIKKIQIL